MRTLLLLGLLAALAVLARPDRLPAAQADPPLAACDEAREEMGVAIGGLLTSEDEAIEAMLERVRRQRRRFRAIEASCTSSLARNEVLLLYLLDRMREAERVLDEIERRYVDVITEEEVAVYLLNRGAVLAALGETEGSTQAYAEAAALADDVPVDLAATVLLNAALTYNELGDRARARFYLRRADSTARANLDSTGVRSVLGEIELEQAITIQAEAETAAAPEAAQAEARAAAERALDLLDSADAQSPDRAMAHLVIARAAIRTGDVSAAEAALATARPLAETASAYAPYVSAERWMTEGELAGVQGQGARARSSFQNALDVAQSDRLPSTAVRSLMRLAEVEEKEGSLLAAEEAYLQAIEIGETIRQRQGLQDWSLSASEQVSEPSERLAALLAQQGRHTEAFQRLDASRARRFLDLRANLRARQRLDDEARVVVDSLLDALDDVRLGIPSAAVTERAALEAEATRIQRALADASGVDLQPPDSLDVRALQRALRGRALVSYVFGPEAGWAFVVRADTLAAVPLASSGADVTRGTERISAMWGAESVTEGGEQVVDPDFDVEALEELYSQVVAPVDALIEGAESLIVVPASQLATIPVGMLVAPEGPADYAQAAYLIRRFPVATELAAALLLAPETEPASGGALIYGRSEFRDRAALPFVRDEVRRVRRTLPSPTLRLNERATEADLLSRLPGASLLHLASHATADPSFPLHSQIVLSDDENADDDGTLHLYELQNQPLAAELVVLSGCSTARGRTLRGEGMVGLQYAVRAAGASSALATLWPVDDQATVEVMGLFYEHLARGLTKDQALQQAQLGYIEASEGMEASPFYWAPAILSGDPSPVPWRGPRRGALWAVLAAAVAVAAGVAWWLTRRRVRA